ncbi:Stealth CR1 domain-containing protein [Pediococcus acidilactici]|uniref:Stealth CR1 domain-containing protein n=1 Tax=Pediococcus acidilactici TaxID=1254 RepID=A0AAW8YT09_PEDAC|nr:Stealth CR1 domain-containing protein [Pediococcus acidilactici]MDV2912142.1 Stealth CR1 domain-containing protein [Pediococcus acidilactici]WQS17434.1 Stealth CR1 domain-containing protein [Pediococcus acidilactici]
MREKIDFVVTWVDSNDINWQKKMNGHLKKMGKKQLMVGEERYHDFGFFKYWFRAVEKYAPWVNHVYVLTDQQVPYFFTQSEKVTIVDHSEFIPKEYLPTFNSNSIEMFLDKIPELSEHFVYFNDDMLLNAPVTPSDFFDEHGVPLDMAVPSVLQPVGDFDHIPFNNMIVINREFPKNRMNFKQLLSFFSYKYGLTNLVKAAMTIPFTNWSTFKIQHVAYSLRKKDFLLLKKYANSEFRETAQASFRSSNDISIWLLLEIRFMLGEFVPRTAKLGKYHDFDTTEELIKDLNREQYKILCINDDSENKKMDIKISESKRILAILEKKFPKKSSVEK